jgi:hypothetical protein
MTPIPAQAGPLTDPQISNWKGAPPWGTKARRTRIKAGSRRSRRGSNRPEKSKRSKSREPPNGEHSGGVGSLCSTPYRLWRPRSGEGVFYRVRPPDREVYSSCKQCCPCQEAFRKQRPTKQFPCSESLSDNISVFNSSLPPGDCRGASGSAQGAHKDCSLSVRPASKRSAGGISRCRYSR